MLVAGVIHRQHSVLTAALGFSRGAWHSAARVQVSAAVGLR